MALSGEEQEYFNGFEAGKKAAADEIDRQAAEIERLRDALANVASLSHNLAVVMAHVNEQSSREK